MTWNPLRHRGEILRARRTAQLEERIREGMSATTPASSPPVPVRDRAELVRRIKAVLAA